MGASSATGQPDDVDSDDARDIIGIGNPTAHIERRDTSPTSEGTSAEDQRQPVAGERKGLNKEGEVAKKTKPRRKTAHQIAREKLHSKANRRRQRAREPSEDTNGVRRKLKKVTLLKVKMTTILRMRAKGGEGHGDAATTTKVQLTGWHDTPFSVATTAFVGRYLPQGTSDRRICTVKEYQDRGFTVVKWNGRYVKNTAYIRGDLRRIAEIRSRSWTRTGGSL